MRQAHLTLTLILVLLLSTVAGTLFSTIASAQYTDRITISASGSVEGTDQIQRDGDTYVFKAGVSGSIVVERDNIVLDGAGYALTPRNDAVIGVDIRDRNDVTLKNLTIKGFKGRCAILLIDTTNCDIIQNNLTDNNIGIEMTGTSSRNSIAENHVQNNAVGMEIYSVNPGSDNTISGNKVTNNSFGMQTKDFLNTKILGNNISSNSWGLSLGVGSGSTARNNVMDNNTYGFRAFNVQAVNVDVDTSNTVNGKPIIYWVNQHGKTVPADACYVALIGCTGITVKNLDLGGNLEGVFLGSTTNSTITNNRLSKCLFGVNLDASSNNTISGNIITGNENGIHLRWSSLNNVIQGNDITANTAAGIYMADSAQNKIIGNNIANSDRGIYTEYCGTNIIHHNNFANNSKQWDDIGFTPWPIPLPISTSVWDDGREGNYWSDYEGTDADGDGIGDTPYIVGTNNTDYYPLMKPFSIPSFPNGSGETEPFSFVPVAVTTVAAVVAVSAGLLAYFKKRNHGENTNRVKYKFVPHLFISNH
jgi:parallel beta-helix repeat protein